MFALHPADCTGITNFPGSTKNFTARHAYQTTRHKGQYNWQCRHQPSELPAMSTSLASYWHIITRYAYPFINYQAVPKISWQNQTHQANALLTHHHLTHLLVLVVRGHMLMPRHIIIMYASSYHSQSCQPIDWLGRLPHRQILRNL